MSKEFITNQEQLLSEVVNNYLKDSDNLYFLVGFFYFSGFEEIVENIGDKKLKVLVGLEAGKGLMNRVKEVETVIVDPELPGIISREDYEKAGAEEFAEWENV
jgi:hypothetical protein